MLGSRKIRVAAAIFVLTAVANLLWPRATGFVSTFAVVNAPVVTVRAPVNGIVLQPSPGLSAPVQRDDVLFDMRSTFDGRTDIARLKGELIAKEGQAEALRDEEQAMADIIAELRARETVEMESELQYLTEKINEEYAIRRMHAAQWDQAEYDFERSKRLAARGTSPSAEVESLGFELQIYESLMSASEARVAALLIEVQSIEQKLSSPAGTGRRHAAFDRLHDMETAFVDIQTRRRTSEGEVNGIIHALSELQAQYDNTNRFQPVAATNGIIWTASRSAGASVTLGSDLFQVLDCDRRFMEVIFNERAFEDIPPGTEARVQLRGSQKTFVARVTSRHAAGSGAAQSAVDAAVLEPHENGGVKVFLQLDPVDVADPETAAAFCDVGRTAEVQIRTPEVSKWLETISSAIKNISHVGSAVFADARALNQGE